MDDERERADSPSFLGRTLSSLFGFSVLVVFLGIIAFVSGLLARGVYEVLLIGWSLAG